MKILILGGTGTIGSSITRELRSDSFFKVAQILTPTRSELDLQKIEDLNLYLQSNKPEIVINAAGMVAGILGNLRRPADLILSNLRLSSNIISACLEANIERYIQFASACIYPEKSAHNARIEDLLSGPIEKTSQSYAVAKIAALEAVSAINRQFEKKWITVIPSNIYGPFDWKHGDDGHVVAMLTKKFINATKFKFDNVEIWGDGTAKRSFLHVDDLAAAVSFLVKNNVQADVINVSTRDEISIGDLARLISKFIGYEGQIYFDKAKPSGAMQKNLDDTFLRSLGWLNAKNIPDGIEDYLRNYIVYSIE